MAGVRAAPRIRDMAIYVYHDVEVDEIVQSSERLRRRFCVAAGILLAAACVVAMLKPSWIFGPENHARAWVLALLAVFVAGPLAENLLRWKSRSKKLRESLRSTRVEVSSWGVRVLGDSGMQALERAAILRAEEVPWGLYLRSANRYRWILLPARIADFRALKWEIAEMRIDMVPAAVAPNWEEFVGALVFAATVICAIFAHSAWVLAGNLAVSVALAAAGFAVASANPENLPKMKWARLGIFLPVAMTASMLWSAWPR
jgi:hypothetical protein